MAARPQNPKLSRSLPCCRGYRVAAGAPDARRSRASSLVPPLLSCGVFCDLLPSPRRRWASEASRFPRRLRFPPKPSRYFKIFRQKKGRFSDSLAPRSRPTRHAPALACAVLAGRLARAGWIAPTASKPSQRHQGLVPVQHERPATHRTVCVLGQVATPWQPLWSTCPVTLPFGAKWLHFFFSHSNQIDLDVHSIPLSVNSHYICIHKYSLRSTTLRAHV
eukprot:SAG31_NODE_4363_length_3311_cov_2.091532_4_plen_220_part_00